MDGFGVGVDLGTSNTVAVLRWPDGRTRPLLHDGAPIMPSGVFLDEAGRLHVGRDAQRMAQLDPARFEPNPKRRVDEAAVLLGDREVPVADLFAALLGAVGRAAVEAVGFLPPAVLTYPAAWGPVRREILTRAAARAGWPPVRLVPEPVAATRYFTGVLRRPVPVGSSIAVFDFGGGTLDVAVVRNDGTGFTVLGSGGIEDLGGLDIDAALVDHLGATLRGSVAWAALTRPGTATDRRNRRVFWDDVRGAKEMLSRATAAPVAVPGVEDAVHLTREELERVAGPLLRRAVYETAGVISRCGLRPDHLAGLFLVGGSSRLPLAARMLHAELGVAPTVLEQPELPVAEGALAEPPPPAPVAVPAAPVAAPAAPVAAPASSQETIALPPPPVAAPASSPPARPWHRRRLVWVAAAVVVALVATLALVLVSRDPSPVRFADLAVVGQPFAVTGDGYVSEQFTAVVGDRAYAGYVTNKELRLTALDTGTAKPVWKDRVVGSGDNWVGLVATPDAVVATVDRYGSGDRSRTAYVVDPADGRVRWSKPLDTYDELFYFDRIVVLASRRDHAVRGFDLASGASKWSHDYPRNEYGSQNAVVFDVPTDADVSGPARLDGAPAAPDRGDDHRLLMVSDDKSLQVYDVRTGKRTGKRGGVGASGDTYLAHAGQLYVATGAQPYGIVAYDLDKLDKPQIIYTAPDGNRRLQRMSACGEGRLCVLDTAGSADKTAEVAAIDVAAGRQVWRRAAPGATGLTPVGDRILVTGAGSLFLGRDGKPVLKPEDRRGTALRVNSASLLVLSGAPSTSLADIGLVGVDATDGGRTPLGTLSKAHGKSCSWNEYAIVCATDKAFTIWRFAGS